MSTTIRKQDQGQRAELAELRFSLQHLRRTCQAKQDSNVETPADRIKLPMHPQRQSPWTWERWSEIRELSEYRFVGAPADREILYRGVRFRPGDLIAGDQSSPLSGIFTGMFEEPSLAAHLAVVVMLEKDGRIFPAALECYKFGVRAVPLSIYLSERFTSYAEVYRLKDTPPGWAPALEAAALTLLSEPHGYAFNGEQDDRRFLTCTTLASELFERTGVEPLQGNSRFASGVVRNFNGVGLDGGSRLTPSDFILSPRFLRIGTFDHGSLSMHVTRALVAKELRAILASEQFDPRRLPLSYKLRAWGVGQVRKETKVGRALRRFAGFSADNFPGGSDELIAIVGLLEDWALPMIAQCEPEIEGLLRDRDSFSLSEFCAEPKVVQLLTRAARPVRRQVTRLSFVNARQPRRAVFSRRQPAASVV